MQKLGGYARVAGDARSRKALVLDIPCCLDALPDACRGLLLFARGQVGKLDRGDIKVYIKAVEHRSRNFVEVMLDLMLRADALFCGVTVISAGAGGHSAYQHERAGVGDAPRNARDGDLHILKRLAQDLERGARELGKLVKKEQTVMGKRNFARARCGAAACKSCRGHGMVRRTEWAGGYKRVACVEQTCNGVYARCFDSLLKGHFGEY